MTPTAPTPPQLEYAPANPRRARRRRILRWLLAFTVLALTYVGWRHGSEIKAQARLLYLQRQCLTYAPGPNVVAFSSDPADLTTLAQRPGYQTLIGRSTSMASAFTASLPPCWVDYTAAALPKRSPTGRAAIVFCHQRTSATGVRRLVVIERTISYPHYPYNPLNLDVVLVDPASIRGKPVDRTPVYPNIRETGAIAIEPVPFHIFAGQADPNDAARFSIRYREAGNVHYLDGRLNDDGGDVKLTFRSPTVEGSP